MLQVYIETKTQGMSLLKECSSVDQAKDYLLTFNKVVRKDMYLVEKRIDGEYSLDIDKILS